jgi:hypothetical protein
MKRSNLNAVFLLAAAVLTSLGAHRAQAQAVATASGPGSFISLGMEASGFQQDYGKHYIGGETVFVDANLYRRIGIEAEGRLLNAHTAESVKEQTYLIGPKITALPRRFRPYVKLLAGGGKLDFPFHYAKGSYFVVAPGAGLDFHLAGRLSVRVADFEYQIWPQFSFGQLHPYGISSGLSFDLYSPGGRPHGLRFRH